MFTDPTGGVGYAFGEKLPSSHMNTLTSDHPHAVDGAGGGAYSLGASLTLASSSAYVLWSTSGLTLGDIANANLLTIGAAGGKWFGAWATGGAGTTVSFAAGAAVSSACNWSITAGTFLWQTGARLELDASSPLVSSGPAAFYGDVLFAAGSTCAVQTTLAFSNGGHARERLVTGATTNHTYHIADADMIRVPALSSSIDYTFSNAGCAGGESIVVYLTNFADTMNMVTLKTDGGASLVALRSGTSTFKGWAKLVHNGTDWELGLWFAYA